jgi:hypothetical protein
VILLEALSATSQTKKVLAERLGWYTATGKPDTRRVELEINDARHRSVPIVSDSDGYRFAQTPAEARQCAERLRNRAIRQMETAAGLDRAADNLERARLTLWDAA